MTDEKDESSSEDSSNEDIAVGKVSKAPEPYPEKYAAKTAATAAKTDENSDGDRLNSDEEPNPKTADKAKRQPAREPQYNKPPAKHVSTAARTVSNVLAQETQHKPKENELNTKKRS